MDSRVLSVVATLVLVLVLLALSLAMFFGRWGLFKPYTPTVPPEAFSIKELGSGKKPILAKSFSSYVPDNIGLLPDEYLPS